MWKSTARKKFALPFRFRAGHLWGVAIILAVALLCGALLAFGP